MYLPVCSMVREVKADLRVHLNQVEEDHIFPLYFNGFVKRILGFGFDHLVQKLRAHGAEILFPQVILLQEHETIIKVANQSSKSLEGGENKRREKPQNPENWLVIFALKVKVQL